MIYTLPESQDAKLSNSAYGIVFSSVFMEIWTNLSTLQHHCNIFLLTVGSNDQWTKDDNGLIQLDGHIFVPDVNDL